MNPKTLHVLEEIVIALRLLVGGRDLSGYEHPPIAARNLGKHLDRLRRILDRYNKMVLEETESHAEQKPPAPSQEDEWYEQRFDDYSHYFKVSPDGIATEYYYNGESAYQYYTRKFIAEGIANGTLIRLPGKPTRRASTPLGRTADHSTRRGLPS